MIVTCKSRVPFHWIMMVCLPVAAIMFKVCVMGGAFIFSLKKFVENPAGLTFILSLPTFVSMVLSPGASFMSDRIWTRFGRRKPFVLTSWCGTIICITLMPLMPNFWSLVLVYVLFSAFNDLGNGPLDTLNQEVVPPRQRTTSAGINSWVFNFSILTFNLVAIGRFDDYKFMAGVPLTGEQSIYWCTALVMATMLMLIGLGIRETEQQSKLRGQRFTLRNFFGGILNQNLWPVYLLITGWGVLNAGLGALGALLYTDQWGFTKQEMGYNFVIGGTLNIFLIAIITYYAQKLPRMKSYQVLMVLFIIINFCFYLYVHHVLYDRRPTLVELVLFGETLSVISVLMGMLYTPLVYDYVPRNELGTYSAGANITNRLTGIITLNGVGLFIWAYATLFLPPGGEMARVTFNQPKTKTEVAALCAPVIPTNQANNAKRISAEAWYATGAALDYGRGFEIRLKNDDSVKLKEQRDKLNQERTGLLAKQSNAKGFAEAAARKNEAAVQRRHQATADALAEQIKPLTARIEKLDAELATRAEKFRDELKVTLGSQLLAEGEQIRAATVNPALVFEYALSRRPASSKIEGTLDALRKVNPKVIDMRLIHRKEHWMLAVSVENTSTNAEGKLGEQVGSTLVTVGGKRLGDALVSPVVPVSTRTTQAVGLDLLVLEDPLDRHVSPVMRVAYWVVSLFGDSPQPERRLSATARALRQPGYCDHVSLRLASDTDNVVRVLAIYEKPIATVTNSTDLTAGVSGRFLRLLPGQPVETLNQAVDLYLHTIPAAAQNRLTVGRPFVNATFAPMKYDYMSGYIWMLLLGVGALFITILFARREAKGLIQKRGRIEADAEQAAEDAAESREQHGDKNAVPHYTPGHSIRKLGMAGFGALMIAVASVQIGPELRLMVWGARAQAEAVRVVKQKLGSGEKVFTSDAEVRAAEEQRDRSYVFWNEYQFQMPDGKSVEFRAPSGSQLKPANSLLDKDGLPTTVWVCYDPKNPQRVTLPFEYSTWFVPGVLAGFGLVCFINGCVLFYFARKPIALPILPSSKSGNASTSAA